MEYLHRNTMTRRVVIWGAPIVLFPPFCRLKNHAIRQSERTGSKREQRKIVEVEKLLLLTFPSDERWTRRPVRSPHSRSSVTVFAGFAWNLEFRVRGTKARGGLWIISLRFCNFFLSRLTIIYRIFFSFFFFIKKNTDFSAISINLLPRYRG